MTDRAILIGTAPPDLAVLWEWEYDRDFVAALERRAFAAGVSVTSVPRGDLATLATLKVDSWLPTVVLDRASDVLPDLVPVLTTWRSRGVLLVNDADRMAWCRDKGTLHLELVAAGLPVPYARIVTADDRRSGLTLDADELAALGSPFIIKPATGGGGEGVVLDARDGSDVVAYLDQTGYDKVLLQGRVEPEVVDGRSCWYRVFHVGGTVIPCWWDVVTHEYRVVEPADGCAHHLDAVAAITRRLASISGIELFTTEIACDRDGRLVVVDFVNEMPDLRPGSKFVDGVPDGILEGIVDWLVAAAVVIRNARAVIGLGPKQGVETPAQRRAMRQK
jgi:hypothetical protein